MITETDILNSTTGVEVLTTLIKEHISQYGEFTPSEIGLRSSPIISQSHFTVTIITSFNKESVTAYRYLNDNKGSKYSIPYIELDIDILDKIYQYTKRRQN